MRFIQLIVLPVCLLVLLAGCSNKGIIPPDTATFKALPKDAAKDSVKSPKVPQPPSQ